MNYLLPDLLEAAACTGRDVEVRRHPMLAAFIMDDDGRPVLLLAADITDEEIPRLVHPSAAARRSFRDRYILLPRIRQRQALRAFEEAVAKLPGGGR